MNIRHIVAMRFLCMDFGIKTDTPENIEFYSNICRDYTAKSLQNMKNKKFECVFLVNDNNDLSHLAPLIPTVADLDATLVRYGKFTEFCEKYRGDGNLIVTRCDADDLYANWLVDEVQLEAEKRSGESFVFGYVDSLLYRIGVNKLRKFTAPYRTSGHFSCFQSVVYGKDCRMAGIQPYAWVHHSATKKLVENGIPKEEALKMIVQGDESRYPFIWMRNGRNGSHDDDPSKDEKYQEITIDGYTPERIEEIYGVKLPLAPADQKKEEPEKPAEEPKSDLKTQENA